jgi:branched-chain amino acid transport system substrate-binding protein
VAALAAAIAGCGGVDINASGASEVSALTIYSSLPLQGPDAASSTQIVNGEKLALAQSGGRVGRLHIGLVSLNDADPNTGVWNPGLTSIAARTASQDKNAIAYVGEFSSGASAVSLPLVNEAGILQISPASSYVGLTSQTDAGKGEPDRYYPTGVRTFVRLVPSDEQQARAQLAYMRALGVRTLAVLGDSDVFSSDIASIVAREAPAAGITVVDNLEVDRTTNPLSVAAKLSRDGADAVFLGGDPSRSAIALWRAVNEADSSLKLFAPGELATPDFLAAIGPAQQRTYVTSAVLPMRFYPRAAQRFASEYVATFHTAPDAHALYGYEAVQATLAAIRAAGAHGTDRAAVRAAFFAIRDRDSVLGRYSVDASGDTTISRFAGDRVVNGALAFDRVLDAGPPPAA